MILKNKDIRKEQKLLNEKYGSFEHVVRIKCGYCGSEFYHMYLHKEGKINKCPVCGQWHFLSISKTEDR